MPTNKYTYQLMALVTVVLLLSSLQLGRTIVLRSESEKPGCVHLDNVQRGKGRCVDWGEDYESCTKPRFDSSEQWFAPRPELNVSEKTIWSMRHFADVENLRNAGEKRSCDIVLLGDSITEAWNRPAFSRKKIASNGSDAWSRTRCIGCGEAPPLRSEVHTFAIGGDRIQDLAWRLFQGGGMDALQKCNPKVISLMIGTNDYGASEEIDVAKAELHLFLRQLKAAKPKGARLVLQAVLPRGDNPRRAWGCASWDPLHHTQLNRILEKSVDASTTFLDCRHKMPLPAEGSGSTEVWQVDLLHPATGGYQRWNECMEATEGLSILA